ncbi:DUF5683 domain-containing protein [Porphyromonas levii]|uniref:DUF5683 domain-containing protein n=1 Tax=Porphyromonas levii TaxID=28114 RepID=UPI0003663FB5|nr:DUF5683 domain-containing protein [Porphyromonas levii]MBR8731274.1 hypothetical protein [Porphyromonas levii]MBR8758876.1 hypothetical protein [Porphyromonas levii]MBR8764010.1 hypothetical protein [Porphyromonas levii]MBR8769253.1 hypothetical protein [Porphyromonas levii]MBR8784209.1 hypothetical protein [Porphyromonas levii]
MIQALRYSFWAILVTVVFALSAHGQQVPDTIPTPTKEEIANQIQRVTPKTEAAKETAKKLAAVAPIQTKDGKPWKPNSTKAVLFSIIPGGGQIYNRVYWKLPIVIGAYTACYYAISWNNNNLNEYATAFRDIKSDTPMEFQSWKEFVPFGADPESYVNNSAFHDQLKRGRDFFRRYRDMSIIVSVAVYALFMIDAYVDAELYSFDISPNLTLTYSPAYMPPTPQTPDSGVGIQLALTF